MSEKETREDEEKNDALRKFQKISLKRLRELAGEYRGKSFLGFVFEELVRSENRFTHSTRFENQLEDFIFACLENRNGLSVLNNKMRRVPDILGFRQKRNKIFVSRVVEVKTSFRHIKQSQIWNHVSDLEEAIERINVKIRRGDREIPDFLIGSNTRLLAVDRKIKPEFVIPSDCAIDSKWAEELMLSGWVMSRSVFSMEEVAETAKLFFSTEIKSVATVPVSQTIPDIKEVLKPITKILENLLQDSFCADYAADNLYEVALIWMCCDHILLDVNQAKAVVSLDTIIKQDASNGAIPNQLKELGNRIEKLFVYPNSLKLMQFVWAYYTKELLIKLENLHKITPKIFLYENILDWI